MPQSCSRHCEAMFPGKAYRTTSICVSQLFFLLCNSREQIADDFCIEVSRPLDDQIPVGGSLKPAQLPVQSHVPRFSAVAEGNLVGVVRVPRRQWCFRRQHDDAVNQVEHMMNDFTHVYSRIKDPSAKQLSRQSRREKWDIKFREEDVNNKAVSVAWRKQIAGFDVDTLVRQKHIKRDELSAKVVTGIGAVFAPFAIGIPVAYIGGCMLEDLDRSRVEAPCVAALRFINKMLTSSDEAQQELQMSEAALRSAQFGLDAARTRHMRTLAELQTLANQIKWQGFDSF